MSTTRLLPKLINLFLSSRTSDLQFLRRWSHLSRNACAHAELSAYSLWLFLSARQQRPARENELRHLRHKVPTPWRQIHAANRVSATVVKLVGVVGAYQTVTTPRVALWTGLLHSCPAILRGGNLQTARVGGFRRRVPHPRPRHLIIRILRRRRERHSTRCTTRPMATSGNG